MFFGFFLESLGLLGHEAFGGGVIIYILPPIYCTSVPEGGGFQQRTGGALPITTFTNEIGRNQDHGKYILSKSRPSRRADAWSRHPTITTAELFVSALCAGPGISDSDKQEEVPTLPGLTPVWANGQAGLISGSHPGRSPLSAKQCTGPTEPRGPSSASFPKGTPGKWTESFSRTKGEAGR